MQYTGRARVDPNHPQAFAVCNRCGFWYNHVDCSWQREWRGNTLANIRVFVCPRCLDRPFIFAKALILPPDPVPIEYAFPENFQIADNGLPTIPPLPWPSQESGPLVPSPPTPPPPVYISPPLPPLPASISAPYPNEAEE